MMRDVLMIIMGGTVVLIGWVIGTTMGEQRRASEAMPYRAKLVVERSI
jgi:hypothetical protein